MVKTGTCLSSTNIRATQPILACSPFCLTDTTPHYQAIISCSRPIHYDEPQLFDQRAYLEMTVCAVVESTEALDDLPIRSKPEMQLYQQTLLFSAQTPKSGLHLVA
jgi:hypothetical protein